jgi:hypothetical protein
VFRCAHVVGVKSTVWPPRPTAADRSRTTRHLHSVRQLPPAAFIVSRVAVPSSPQSLSAAVVVECTLSHALPRRRRHRHRHRLLAFAHPQDNRHSVFCIPSPRDVTQCRQCAVDELPPKLLNDLKKINNNIKSRQISFDIFITRAIQVHR